MKIEINNLVKGEVDLIFLEKFAQKASKLVKLKVPELSIVVVSDGQIKNLNKKYLKRNKATDVLAFDYGEIIICLPRAKRQAKELKHSLKEELAILLIHGILHLAGYNDETKKDFNKMLSKQQEIWRKIKS